MKYWIAFVTFIALSAGYFAYKAFVLIYTSLQGALS